MPFICIIFQVSGDEIMSQGHGNTMVRHCQMGHWEDKINRCIHTHLAICLESKPDSNSILLFLRLISMSFNVLSEVDHSEIWPRFTRGFIYPCPIHPSLHWTERSILSFLHSKSPILEWSSQREVCSEPPKATPRVCVSKYKSPSLTSEVPQSSRPGSSLSCCPGLSPWLTLPHHPDLSALPQAGWAHASPGPPVPGHCLDPSSARCYSSEFTLLLSRRPPQQMWPLHRHIASLFFLQSISHHLIWIYPVSHLPDTTQSR